MRCMKALCAAGAVVWLTAAASAASLEGTGFDGRISRPELERYLSRAITMEAMLHGHGSLSDQIRLLKSTRARFAGRTLYLWGGEENLERLLAGARPAARQVHEALPDLILQAALFEIVTASVETRPIPGWAFEAFELRPEVRNFRYADMLYPDGKHRNRWGRNRSVPDISRIETRLWFYTLAARYLDVGIEALHFGQVELMGGRDPGHRHWNDLLERIRAYARRHARRGLALCDAHLPSGGLLIEGRLLFDFHSFPLRIEEVADRPHEGVLKRGHLDSLYGRSKGGVTPSGWSCESLPYLVELDNWGRSGREGQNIGGHWIWGYDEISWFAHQPRDYRDRWLRYAARWVRENDPAGYLQMPGSRTLAAPVGEKRWYWASRPGPACPDGFGDEETIRAVWAAPP